MLSSEDVRENPGTLALAASWVLVFVLILLTQGSNPSPPAPRLWWEPLPVSTGISHRFGDMTWREVRDGQPWRLVTATFIHFGLVHLTLNALGLINLGRLIEPWYRTGPFLAVCLAIGGLGNLVGGGLRQLSGRVWPWLASVAATRHWPGVVERFFQGGPAMPDRIPTGGGSTILLGLLALGAVVGWRSKTRIGAHLQRQMVILLVLTAAMGLAMSGLIDNYGHLGGALVGGAIGFGDRLLVRLSELQWFRGLCWLIVVLVSLACVGFALRDDRLEVNYRSRVDQISAHWRSASNLRGGLDRLFSLYTGVVVRSEHFRDPTFELDATAVADLLNRGPKVTVSPNPGPEALARERAELEQVLGQLDQTAEDLWGPEVATNLARLRFLGREALREPPAFDQVYDFVVCWKAAGKAVDADLIGLNVQMIELEAARRPRR